MTHQIDFELVDEMIKRNEAFKDPDQIEKKAGVTHEELYGKPEPKLLNGTDAESGSSVKNL